MIGKGWLVENTVDLGGGMFRATCYHFWFEEDARKFAGGLVDARVYRVFRDDEYAGDHPSVLKRGESNV